MGDGTIPHEAGRGERMPDPDEPAGGTPEEREAGKRIEEHGRQSTEPTDPAATDRA